VQQIIVNVELLEILTPLQIGVMPVIYNSVSQTPDRGPVPGTSINYSGPREVLLEFVILIF
jgi:hypothetical protein